MQVNTSGEATICIGGENVSCKDFHNVAIPIRVFNRDFISESVFPVGGGDVPPIFVVGPDSVEKQKEVEQLKKKLTEAELALKNARLRQRDAHKAFDKYCIDRAKVIRDTLRSSGQNLYNNYDKADYRNRADKMVADRDATAHKLSESDRERLLAQHRATPKPKIAEIIYKAPDFGSLEAEVSSLLRQTVVSATIRSLASDPELSSWVHEGLRLHQARSAESCLFCEQPLPTARLAALEAHFSAEYEKLQERLDAKIAELQAASASVEKSDLPSQAEFYDDLADEYENRKHALKAVLRSTKTALEELADALRNKKALAFESLNLTVDLPKVDLTALDRLNETIRKHNEACESLQSRASHARKYLEADSVSTSLHDFKKKTAAVHQAEQSRKQAEEEVMRLRKKIEQLEREIVEHRQPAEELNEDLLKYLGHDELSLEVKDTGYAIMRNGVPATALSEGEMTAIALLYFLKSLDDRRFDLAKGVIVLDDPVSSLDANALYLAFGYIRERTENAGQLFIFTHNFAFFRQVRNWFQHLKGQKRRDPKKRPARFYMLDCVRGEDQRCSTIRPLDPLLEQYESEYHYLFARIYRAARGSARQALEDTHTLPNLARRLLEAFLAFRQPHVSGELWQKLKAVEFDEAKKLRILRFLHTHSHSDSIGEPELDPSLLAEARSVLNDLLELMESEDSRHYSSMEKLMALSSEGI